MTFSSLPSAGYNRSDKVAGRLQFFQCVCAILILLNPLTESPIDSLTPLLPETRYFFYCCNAAVIPQWQQNMASACKHMLAPATLGVGN